MIYKTLWCTLLLAAVGTLPAADLPSDWKNVQTVEISRAGLLKFSVPGSTLDAARPGLEDLRLFTEEGKELPYRLERPLQERPSVTSGGDFRAKLLPESTVAIFDTRLVVPIRAVNFVTPTREFLKSLKLEGSIDGVNWQTILEAAPIFRQANSAQQLLLEIPPAIYQQLRATLDDRNSKPIALTGAEIHAASAKPAPVEPLELSITETEEAPGKTHLTLTLAGANVTLAELALETGDLLFTRPVTLWVREYSDSQIHETVVWRDTVYRIGLPGQASAEKLSIKPDVQIPGRELFLTIDNGDSPPLKISAIKALRRPVYLMFANARPGKLHLICGNPLATAPNYDLASFKGTMKPELVSATPVSPLTTNSAYRAPEALPTVQTAGALIDLAKWKYRKRIELTAGAVHRVELDLDVLAHAVPACSDLRVIRDGKQIPFLIHRTSLLRSLKPEVAMEKDAKRPTLSRWSLKLPLPMLPVTQLACNTSANLFKRSALLIERLTDERGNSYTAQLGSAEWVRSSQQNIGKLSLTISPPPSTDRVFLEIDNGDNSPLVLEDFQFWYPAVSVLFKASAGVETFLYYGNSEAMAPQYDLGLVAPQVLAIEKSKAGLGKEQVLTKSGFAESVGGSMNWAFWIVLGIVVAVLLAVIARLLPKEPAAPAG